MCSTAICKDHAVAVFLEALLKLQFPVNHLQGLCAAIGNDYLLKCFLFFYYVVSIGCFRILNIRQFVLITLLVVIVTR